VDYSDYAVPVVASADGLPNDGAAGEGDNLLSPELSIEGGSGGDTMTGFAGAEGNGGNDHLIGRTNRLSDLSGGPEATG
jgi:hypothetical protein